MADLIIDKRCPVYLLGFIGAIMEQVTSDVSHIYSSGVSNDYRDMFTSTLSSIDKDGYIQVASIGVVNNSHGFIGYEAPFMRSGPLVGDYGIDNYLYSAFVRQLDQPYKGSTYGKHGMIAVNDKLLQSDMEITIYYSSKLSKDPYWCFLKVKKTKL